MTETLLVPDRVFDGSHTREGLVVGIAGDRISYVGPEAGAPDAPRVRLEGATLTPGLIDMHVHVSPWTAYGFIAAGVTTVRDLANDLDRAPGMMQRVPQQFRPTVHWVGPALDGGEVNWPTVSRGHATPEDMAASVRELAERGVEAVKLYANVTGEFMAAAVREAREHGIRVVSHPGTARLTEAVEAGVDEVQHLAGALARDLGYEPGDPAAVDAFLALHVDHCPTLIVWEGMAMIGAPRAHRDTGRAWVPAEMELAWSESRHATQPADERNLRLADLVERMRLVKALYDAGRTIVVGSDAAFIGLAPGFSLHDELGLLFLSGVPPLDVMRAATAGNARVLGIEGEAGVIREGARADLVAFDGDPTSVITDVGRIRDVWVRGARVDAAELRAAADLEFTRPTDGPPDQLALQRYIPAAQY